ncbi:chemotaxis protein CheW [Pseudomonadota bacterium]
MSPDSKQGQQARLNEPDQALSGYLEALLGEVDEYREEPQEPKPAVVAEAIPEEVPAPAIPEVQAVVTEPESTVEPPELPDWGQAPFQCLLFKARGLTLAVPLVVLNSIAEWKEGDELLNLPGQPDWHLGVLKHRGQQVTIMDTTRLIMPERVRMAEGDDLETPSHILIVGNGRWGLQCEKLLKPIMIQPDQVRWCQQKDKPSWMAGTLPDQLCILLDVNALLESICPSGE